MSTARRPKTIQELLQLAKNQSYNPSRDLKDQLRAAEHLRKQGKESERAGDLENAFVGFARAAIIILDKIPEHSQYHQLGYAQKDALAGESRHLAPNGHDLLEKVELLKPRIEDAHEHWIAPGGGASAARAEAEAAEGVEAERQREQEERQRQDRRRQAEDEQARLNDENTYQRIDPEEGERVYRRDQEEKGREMRANEAARIALEKEQQEIDDYYRSTRRLDNEGHSARDWKQQGIFADVNAAAGIENTSGRYSREPDNPLPQRDALGFSSHIDTTSYSTSIPSNNTAISGPNSQSWRSPWMGVRIFLRDVDIEALPFNISGHFGDIFRGKHPNYGVLALKRLRMGPEENPESVRLREIATALSFLHSSKIIHGDIKGRNVLVSPNLEAQVYDFGLARFADARTSTNMKGAGTVRWSSPEVLSGLEKSYASDVYAFGMIIVELLSGNPPFSQYKDNVAVLTAVLIRDERPARTPAASVDGTAYDREWDVAEQCWVTDIDNRVSMDQVIIKLSPQVALGGHSEDEYEEDDQGLEIAEHDSENWTQPRPAPPMNELSREDYIHLNDQEFTLCSRGVPFDMIHKYRMQYDPIRGISLQLEHQFSATGGGINVYRLVRKMGPEDVDYGSDVDRTVLGGLD
ncbi:hypothetical protein FS837_009768 [Tulasnella sp. UAMH 9824]|nr:hypothetical protein FS837_009768 [Tulasnella sp. UAMH 9824]